MSLTSKILGLVQYLGLSRSGTSTYLRPANGTGFVVVNNASGFSELQAEGTAALLASTSTSVYVGAGVYLGLSSSVCRIASGMQFCVSSGTDSSAAAADVGMKRITSKVFGVTDGAAGAGWLQTTAGEFRRTATQTVTDTTTFANDNTLSATLITGRRYRFELCYFFTTVNSSGVKIDLGGGGASMTALNAMANVFSSAGAVLAAGQLTTLTTSVGVTASGTFAYALVEGSLEVASGGTFIPRFAQNTETGAAESVVAQIGSYLTLSDVP